MERGEFRAKPSVSLPAGKAGVLYDESPNLKDAEIGFVAISGNSCQNRKCF
jgi:hypothetical protein